MLSGSKSNCPDTQPRVLTLCPICRQYVVGISQEGRLNQLPAPHPTYHPCRSPQTEGEQTVWNYMSIGRSLQFERYGFWLPVPEKLYALCPPKTQSLSSESDPSQPSVPPSKHSVAWTLLKRVYEARGMCGDELFKEIEEEVRFAPPSNPNSKEVK